MKAVMSKDELNGVKMMLDEVDKLRRSTENGQQQIMNRLESFAKHEDVVALSYRISNMVSWKQFSVILVIISMVAGSVIFITHSGDSAKLQTMIRNEVTRYSTEKRKADGL